MGGNGSEYSVCVEGGMDQSIVCVCVCGRRRGSEYSVCVEGGVDQSIVCVWKEAWIRV